MKASSRRCEWALKWILEKLKNREGREECRHSDLIWPFLDQLIRHVPASNVARLLNSTHILVTVKNHLHETVDLLAHALTRHEKQLQVVEGLNVHHASSRKRKRGNPYPNQHYEDFDEQIETLLESAFGITSLLGSIIALGNGSVNKGDAVPGEHIASVLRTSSNDAAEILNAWLRCLFGAVSYLKLCDANNSEY